MVQWCLSSIFNSFHCLNISYKSSSSYCLSSFTLLFLDLEDEEAQVNVFGGQQFVALHRVRDGQKDVVCLVGIIAKTVMVNDRLDPNVVVRTLQQQEGAL